MKQPASQMIMRTEFKSQIGDYLATLKPGYPRTLAELVAKAEDPATGYSSPWKLASMKQGLDAMEIDDPVYLATRNEGLAFVRATVLGAMTEHKLDAVVYPTSPQPARPIEAGGTAGGAGGGESATNIANQTGFPDLIVPAGITKEGLPVTISFFGPAFSEPKLLAYGYDFEQATKARVLPKYTPHVSGDKLEVPAHE
jgi:amidase